MGGEHCLLGTVVSVWLVSRTGFLALELTASLPALDSFFSFVLFFFCLSVERCCGHEAEGGGGVDEWGGRVSEYNKTVVRQGQSCFFSLLKDTSRESPLTGSRRGGYQSDSVKIISRRGMTSVCVFAPSLQASGRPPPSPHRLFTEFVAFAAAPSAVTPDPQYPTHPPESG